MTDYYFECRCHSQEHTLRFSFFREKTLDFEPEIFVSIFMGHVKPMWKRIWYAIKYIFGRNCTYGHWGNWELDEDDALKLKGMVNDFLKANKDEKK